MTNQTVTDSSLTGYIVNVIRSPVIERLMVRRSQVTLKHVIHDMVTRTLVMELRRCAIKRWVACGDMDRRLKIPHSAKVECGFRILPGNAYMIVVLLTFSIEPHNTIQYNTIQYNTIITKKNNFILTLTIVINDGKYGTEIKRMWLMTWRPYRTIILCR